jgi:hypothetical protein
MIIHTVTVYQSEPDTGVQGIAEVSLALAAAIDGIKDQPGPDGLARPDVLSYIIEVASTEGETLPTDGGGTVKVEIHNPRTCSWLRALTKALKRAMERARAAAAKVA